MALEAYWSQVLYWFTPAIGVIVVSLLDGFFPTEMNERAYVWLAVLLFCSGIALLLSRHLWKQATRRDGA
jgi:FtsH-binding integral membrane protein